MARRYTILSAACQTHTHTHSVIELDSGREAGKERGRLEDEKEGARGGWGREGARGGSEESMM